MKIDLLVDPFGARWDDVRTLALTAEEVGFDGLWTWDHLAGSVHRSDGVLEAWTLLTAVAAVTEQLSIGPMVLNVANRDAGTLAVMAATLQEVSGGRLLLGLGAGGGAATPYAAEQQGLGRDVPTDPARRRHLADTIAVLRRVWTGRSGEASGFLRPDPPPPVLIGAFGPRMAELAGRLADGINTPSGGGLRSLVDTAVAARRTAGLDPAGFVVTASATFDDRLVTEGSPGRRRLEQLGVDRLVLTIPARDWRRLASARP